MRNPILRRLAIVVAPLAIASACASTGASTTSRNPDLRSEIVPVDGCAGAWSDPADDSPTRRVVRCTPGAPAPRPLSQRATVVVSIPIRMEFAAPVLLADALGEFDRENLDVRIVNLPQSDAIPQLGQGQIDVIVGGYDVAVLNASRIGLDVKAVMGNYFPPSAGDYSVAQTGLWCRRSSFSDPEHPDMAETQDMRWASSFGKGSVAFYYSVQELRGRVPGYDAARVKTVTVPPTESAAALRNGAVDCATLIDPLWIEFATPDYVLAASQTPGEPLGFVLFGKNLLVDSPAVGDAFARAVVRTINTSLTGDYHADPKVMAVLSEQINQPIDKIARTPSLQYDWELRSGTPDRLQELFLHLGVITGYAHIVPEDHLIDRSFTDRAVGRTG